MALIMVPAPPNGTILQFLVMVFFFWLTKARQLTEIIHRKAPFRPCLGGAPIVAGKPRRVNPLHAQRTKCVVRKTEDAERGVSLGVGQQHW